MREKLIKLCSINCRIDEILMKLNIIEHVMNNIYNNENKYSNGLIFFIKSRFFCMFMTSWVGKIEAKMEEIQAHLICMKRKM